MGSEGPIPIITIHVTGFKKFHGVPQNPTETLVSNLKEFIQRRGLQGISVGSCTILDAAGHGVIPLLYEIMDTGGGGGGGGASSSSLPGSSSNENIIWLHFGAIAGASKFAIERKAVNEATFMVPDEHGWKPQKHPVIAEDGEISLTRQTTCSVEMIEKHLKLKNFDVMISEDAGRFVCNYLYYHSLRLAEQKSHKSLFVHVPLFSRIDEDTQMEFVASLMEALAFTL